MKSKFISIIIPVFNEQGSIEPLYKKLKSVLDRVKHEIIFVDDGSTDNTPDIISKLKNKDKNVRSIISRRNFGKSAALAAGLKNSTGEVIITMDGDLQDDPSDISKFLEKINKGYDLIVGWKPRKYRWYNLKIIPSKIFNILTRLLTGLKLHDFDCPFKAFKRTVIGGLDIYGELHRYIPVLVHQKGFKIGEVKIKNLSRVYGKSKFGYSRIMKGFLDLITVFFLTRFVKRPLHFFGSVGLTLLFLGLILGMCLIIKRLIFGIIIVKEAFILLAILSIILGVQFISIGLIGEMLANLNHGEKDEDVFREK